MRRRHVPCVVRRFLGEQINILVKIPNNGFLNYGDLKFGSGWDPLRNELRINLRIRRVLP
jgi:hypothetical protein